MQIQQLYAHPSNYSDRCNLKKYLVFHYTGNINDSAINNCKYFSEPNRGASAHFFVDDKSIWCSVPPECSAWSVGLGNRNEPYIRQPMYKVITNSNSISIEMCGSKNSTTASELTVKNAILLGKWLMVKYNIPYKNVYRHYDVTGKQCPAWLVKDADWLQFKKLLLEDNTMTYEQFKTYMSRWIDELTKSPGGDWSKTYRKYVLDHQLMQDSAPKMYVTREELATVLYRILNLKDKT